MHTATNKNKNQITTHCKKTKKKNKNKTQPIKFIGYWFQKTKKQQKKTLGQNFIGSFQTIQTPKRFFMKHKISINTKQPTTQQKNKTNKYKNHVTKTNK